MLIFYPWLKKCEFDCHVTTFYTLGSTNRWCYLFYEQLDQLAPRPLQASGQSKLKIQPGCQFQCDQFTTYHIVLKSLMNAGPDCLNHTAIPDF